MALAAASHIPDLTAAPDLLIASDYGGAHAGATHQTYCFLAVDCNTLGAWQKARNVARAGKFERRMHYTKLKDGYRRRLLPHFLDAADQLKGVLATFAVSKALGDELFETDTQDQAIAIPLSQWPPRSRERVLRIASFSSFMIGGLTAQGQNVFWLTDEDEIVANPERRVAFLAIVVSLTTRFFLRGRSMGKLRLTTTEGTGARKGDLFDEDLASIPDLVAGAMAESGIRNPHDRLKLEILNRDDKAGAILRWHFHRPPIGLQPIALSVDPDPEDHNIAQIGWFR